MKSDKIREYFSIPNILSYFRLLLIPVYLYVYFNARTDADYLKAALVIAVSGLTDALDGFIARHFDQITDWGKLIDPVADKLTLAAISISLALRFPLMGAVFALYLAKEGYMLVMGAVMLRRGYRMDGARWYGKVCTAVTYAVMLALLVIPGLSRRSANALICLCLAVTAMAFVGYINFYQRVRKSRR